MVDGLLGSLLAKLHGTCSVSIVINELSGLTEFAVAGDEASAVFEGRLRAASGPLNDGRGSLVRVLTQLRTDVRCRWRRSGLIRRSSELRSRRPRFMRGSRSRACLRRSLPVRRTIACVRLISQTCIVSAPVCRR